MKKAKKVPNVKSILKDLGITKSELLKENKYCSNCEKILNKEGDVYATIFEQPFETAHFCDYFCFMEFCVNRLRMETGQETTLGLTEEEYQLGKLGDILLNYVSILLRHRNWELCREDFIDIRERLSGEAD
jgi:hypothetical protein